MSSAASPTIPVQPPAGAATAVSELATMPPAYFAMAMATGIVSIACHLQGFATLARGLFWLNIGVFVVLWVLLFMRIARYGSRVWADLGNHGRGVGFFTMVAAASVLGTQFLLLGQNRSIAFALWYLALGLWAILIYTIFTLLTVKPVKPTLAEGINGGWLVAVVAGQSLCVLGAQLAGGLDSSRSLMLFFCLAIWLGSGMLYIWIISLIFYRYTFFTLQPSDLSPPYWINMGAVAISTLAGTMLIANASLSPVLTELLPFIKGITLAFWATATWWIPMLVILGVWRHGYKQFPVKYDPLYWGAVFPLGMYTACTFRTAESMQLSFLYSVPRVFIYIALAAWAFTFIGLVRHLLRFPARG